MKNISKQKKRTEKPSLREASKVWWKIGLISFGGPAGQIALMHRIIVEERQWLDNAQFLNALSFCMLLPGPEAMQLATYSGWRLHGVLGGLIAGLFFILPGAALILALVTLYSFYGDIPFIEALFYGIKAAVLVVVCEALLRVAKKALSNAQHWIIAGLAFTAIFFFSLPFPLIISAAAVYGWIAATDKESHKTAIQSKISTKHTLQTILIWLVVWLLPLILLWQLDANELLIQIGVFFSKLAVVTFGGAYAVLAYMAQDVVVQKNWLTVTEMIDALGLAETTPGPLILVTEFVGFLSGFKQGGFLLGLGAGAVTLWVTFMPCFLWIFAGAPYLEWVASQPKLSGALKAITAAVVGVMLNLSIWFALHVLFSSVKKVHFGLLTIWQPTLSSLETLAILLFGLGSVLVFKFHMNIIKVMLITSLLGAVLKYLIN